MLVLKVSDELRGNEAAVFGVFDSSLEQFDVETGVSQSSDDNVSVSNGSCFLGDVGRYCEGSEQCFRSTSIYSCVF